MDGAHKIRFVDTVPDFFQCQMQLSQDLAHEASVSVAEPVGNHLISRQTAGQIEISAVFLKEIRSGGGGNGCRRGKPDLRQCLGYFDLLSQAVNIAGVLQNEILSHMTGGFVFVACALLCIL